MKAYEAIKLGEHRGSPRLWLQGMKAEIAGFLPGMRFNIRKDPAKHTLVLELNQFGDRIVSRKVQGEKVIPIIDINSSEALSVFEGFNSLRITIDDTVIKLQPMAVEIAKKERIARLKAKLEAGEPIAVGSIAHGGGVLSHAIHTGLQDGGLKARLAFANEIRPELLEHAYAHNNAWDAKTIPLIAPMQELAFDPETVNSLPKVEILEGGIPCSGASLSGRARNGAGHAESHPEVGHLIVPFLAIIAKVQPLAILLENVKPWQNSASMCILRNTLRDFGYTVHETILHAGEWNELESRSRLGVVAVTEGLDLDLSQISRPAPLVRTLAEVLDQVPEDDPNWDEMAYLKHKQEMDAEKGRQGRKGTNFKMQIVTADSTSCPVITKGYSKRRSTDPKLAHPSNPNLLRQFTVAEHARIKGIPEWLVKMLGVTLGHELIGQSVCYGPFRAVGKLLANVLLSVHAVKELFKRSAPMPQQDLFGFEVGVPA